MITVESGTPGVESAALSVVREVAAPAFGEVKQLLPALADDLVLTVVSGGPVIPETGELGASVARGQVEWHVDRNRPGGVAGVARRELRGTLFHELHHQVRGWVLRGGPRPATFIEGPVSEGLASAFERDAAGRRAPWAEYPPDVDGWVRELLALRLGVSYREWMFQHPDGRRWIGYRAGTYLADRAIEASGRSAAQLVTTPASEILKLGGYDPERVP